MTSRQFFTVETTARALATLFQNITPLSASEMLQTITSFNRILISAPQSPMDLPTFNRSAMDGFAVQAKDTFGASDSLPAYLTVIGHVAMGEVANIQLQAGQAIEIHTGAMLPEGADAVVMVERTQRIADNEIEVLAPVAPNENVILLGEDVRKGSATLPRGHRIRPQDIGGLLAVGIHEIEVAKQPRIGILSCGDELVDARDTPKLGQIRDINSHMLMALCQEIGAEVTLFGIARDTFDSLYEMAREGLEKSDMLILSAGSSVSSRDLTADVIAKLGEPGILHHGLAVKPGKPTIIAVVDGKPIIGLPGNPVSAMLVARQIILPTIRYLTKEIEKPIMTVQARLTQNIASTSGREDSVPVRLIKTNEGYMAEPIWGKSNLIYTLLKADGIVNVPLNISGYTNNTMVDVRLF
jgi:molybdopterin molybdotransferase